MPTARWPAEIPFRCLVILLVSLWTSTFVTAQGLPPFKLYETSKQGIIFSILQDDRGLLWVSTATGLYAYDGISFDRVKNDFTGFSSLAKDASGTLYLSYHNHFGTLATDSVGRVTFNSLLPLVKSPIPYTPK